MRPWPFLYQRRIVRLDELGQTLVVHLVMRLEYKDVHKTHYASGPTFLRKYVLNDTLRKVVRLDA